jgi:DNA-directed RNA polymerase specialized sigma24 family protein
MYRHRQHPRHAPSSVCGAQPEAVHRADGEYHRTYDERASDDAQHDARRADLIRSLSRLRAGEREQFRSIFDMLRPTILALARRRGLDWADADDLCQTVLLKIYLSSSRYLPGLDGFSWAMAIAVFELKTEYRRRFRRRESPLTDERLLRANETVEDVVGCREELVLLDGALKRLPTSAQAIVLSSLFEGGWSEQQGTRARKQKQRAFQRLRDESHAAFLGEYDTRPGATDAIKLTPANCNPDTVLASTTIRTSRASSGTRMQTTG